MSFIKEQQEEQLAKWRESSGITTTDFIAQAVSQVVQNTVEEIERGLGKVESVTGNAAQFNFEPDWYIGYNQALADVQSLLKDITTEV